MITRQHGPDMTPKIRVTFRRRNGVPYAREQLSGMQFRCRHCNAVFLREKELDRHIQSVAEAPRDAAVEPSTECPTMIAAVAVKVLYGYDLRDRLRKQWLKLKPGDVYDGL